MYDSSKQLNILNPGFNGAGNWRDSAFAPISGFGVNQPGFEYQPIPTISAFDKTPVQQTNFQQYGSAYNNTSNSQANTNNANNTQVAKSGIRSILPDWQWLQGTDTYQQAIAQGQDNWGKSIFGSGWDPMSKENKDMYWNNHLRDLENSPNRYQGGLLNTLGSFRDISALGLGIAGLMNQKKMADRQYKLQRESFDLAKEDYYNREARAKEEFAARRNARSGGQI